MSANSARRRLVTVGALTAAAALTLTACSGNPVSGGESDDDTTPASSESEEEADPVQLKTNVKDGATGVKVDKTISVSASGGTLKNVKIVTGKNDRIAGSMAGGGSKWKTEEPLESGKKYRVIMRGTNSEGDPTTERTSFRTQDLTLDQQTYASISPLDGATVGIGMPIIVKFDIGVTNKAAIERNLEVKTDPKVEGSWSWLSDNEVHFRPKNYWPAGTEITVDANVNSIKAGPNLWGQENNSATFTVTNDTVQSIVDVDDHKMTVKVNGKVAKTMPVTAGKAGFTTRSGTKLVMAKHDVKRMDAASVGIDKNDPEYYNIPDVQYAMRVTSSGEFVHAAPWSVDSQGSSNVSHGCIGLNTSNAKWLYDISHIGDPVKFVDSPRGLEQGNGWTDWNQSYQQFKQGSAL